MKTKDIVVGSAIYAIGAMGTWAQWRARPGFVLGFKDRRAVVLMHTGKAEDQRAGLADAARYTLEDYNERRATIGRYGWRENDERDAALAALKPVPKGWGTDFVPLSNVRMPWAEYDVRRLAHEAEEVERRQSVAERNEENARLHTEMRDILARQGIAVPAFGYGMINASRRTVTLSFDQIRSLINEPDAKVSQ